MAMPCSPGLSPHSVWMVFSAPEMTTVSKPKRNPASAEVSDQKKMRPLRVPGADVTTAEFACGGMFTELFKPLQSRLLFSERITFFAPVTNSAIHRDHLGISHFLQIV